VSGSASLARRLASLAYEALLLTAIVLVAGFALAPLVTPAVPGVRELRIPGIPERVMLFCALFAIAAAYFVASWTAGRRTLPMKTWRLRLVDANGAPVDAQRALARYLAGWIGPALALGAFLALHPLRLGAHAAWLVALNYLWALVDRDGLFLHDRIAGTRLVAENGVRLDFPPLRPRNEPRNGKSNLTPFSAARAPGYLGARAADARA
jgi:uncharacterized RDD family membrane protein YckC